MRDPDGETNRTVLRGAWSRPARVTDNADELFDIDLFHLPEGSGREEDRAIVVAWQMDGAEVTAVLKAANGVVRVASFHLETTSGPDTVSLRARRLPSDGTVLRAVHAFGPAARQSLQWLVGGTGRYVEHGRRRLAAGEPLDGALLENALADYVKEASKRSPAKVRAQIELAKSMLVEQRSDPTIKAQSIIDRLIIEDVSSATAWRRLRAARRELGG